MWRVRIVSVFCKGYQVLCMSRASSARCGRRGGATPRLQQRRPTASLIFHVVLLGASWGQWLQAAAWRQEFAIE